MNGFHGRAGLIFSIAETLRGDYKPADFGHVTLPFVLLRRLDAVLVPTKPTVLEAYEAFKDNIPNLDPILQRAADQKFYNTSKFDFDALLADPDGIAANLRNYVNGFSPQVRSTFEKFGFLEQIDRLAEKDLLYNLMGRFKDVDLDPKAVTNLEMGYLFEELIRRFAEQSNETAGEHFTPREVIHLMVDLLFMDDRDELVRKGIVRTLYDPTCGTGGMLSVAEEYLRAQNEGAQLQVYGQELNDETYAICQSDMMVKGYDPSHIVNGNSLTRDGFAERHFDYFLANPPYGVEWKKIEGAIRAEHEQQGDDGRFGAGLPRINDGSFLFLQHMIAKWKLVSEGGARLGIVFNGSPLFTGAAGSGESEIRRWIIENDWLEAIVALPKDLFYNTNIQTYVWVLTNRKPNGSRSGEPDRRGKVQLIDASGDAFYRKMRKSLGDKRNEIGRDQIDEVVRLYGDFADGPHSKIFDNAAFGYRRVTVERPLRVRYEATDEGIATALSAKVVRKFVDAAPEGGLKGFEEAGTRERDLCAAIRVALTEAIDDIDAAGVALERALKERSLIVPKAVHKAVVEALAVREEDAPIARDGKGSPIPDPALRDYEDVPLSEDIDAYMAREVLPHVPDVWINATVVDPKDGRAGKVGYEINFNRYFYKYTPPRPLDVIDAELKVLEGEISDLLNEVTT